MVFYTVTESTFVFNDIEKDCITFTLKASLIASWQNYTKLQDNKAGNVSIIGVG
jgi:hypothetical protein